MSEARQTELLESLSTDIGSLIAVTPDSASFDRATGAAAIAHTLAPGVAWQLESIRVHLSAAGGAGDLTAQVDHAVGAAYDFVILKQDMTTLTDLVWNAERPMEFAAGDKLDIAWANAGAKTYGLEIIWKSR